MKSDSTPYHDIFLRLSRGQQSASTGGLQLDLDWLLARAVETRRSDYHWHGLARGADSQHPYLVFQCSLDGFGIFEHAGKVHRLDAGKGFLALVPSDHRYFLPPDSASWTFFWVTIHHPYVVSRLKPQIEQTSPVLSLTPDSLLLARSIDLWEQIQNGGARDSLGCEQTLFDWMFETERFCRALLHPQDERERWLQNARNAVMGDLQNPCPVEKLATQMNLSRSHYSHLFKAATGFSPAAWVAQVRLEEVARRLTNTDDKLQKVAVETGYGDANHLCKVFRRTFHLSPNQFRRQMR